MRKTEKKYFIATSAVHFFKILILLSYVTQDWYSPVTIETSPPKNCPKTLFGA